jgi:hypothetical protein
VQRDRKIFSMVVSFIAVNTQGSWATDAAVPGNLTGRSGVVETVAVALSEDVRVSLILPGVNTVSQKLTPLAVVRSLSFAVALLTIISDWRS